LSYILPLAEEVKKNAMTACFGARASPVTSTKPHKKLLCAVGGNALQVLLLLVVGETER